MTVFFGYNFGCMYNLKSPGDSPAGGSCRISSSTIARLAGAWHLVGVICISDVNMKTYKIADNNMGDPIDHEL